MSISQKIPETLLSEVDVITRIFDHIDHKTTDLGQATWREPTNNYQCTERLKSELDVIRNRWGVFCPAAALPNNGDYIARESAGVPLIVVRSNDGVVRAFRNACRHRGVQVANGKGCSRVFVCPYHGWTYGNDGQLRSIPHEQGFPETNKETRGLVAVDCVEQNGLVFVKQNTGIKTDDGLTDLSGLIPDGFRVIETDTRDVNANWKLHLESSLEGYHIRSTHNKTFFPVQYDNLTVIEKFGENSRVSFPYQAVEGLRDKPKSSWSTNGRMTQVYHLFPNVIISTFPDCIQVVMLDPTSLEHTYQHMFLMANCDDNSAAYKDIMKGQEFAKIGSIEDLNIVMSAQQGLKAKANEYLEFGLYESAIGHFHKNLTNTIKTKEA